MKSYRIVYTCHATITVMLKAESKAAAKKRAQDKFDDFFVDTAKISDDVFIKVEESEPKIIEDGWDRHGGPF